LENIHILLERQGERFKRFKRFKKFKKFTRFLTGR